MIKAYYSQEACTKWGSAIFLIDGKEVEVTSICREGEYKWIDAVDLGAVEQYRFLRHEQIGFYQAEDEYLDRLQASDYEDDLNHLDDLESEDEPWDSEPISLDNIHLDPRHNSRTVVEIKQPWLGYRLHHNMN